VKRFYPGPSSQPREKKKKGKEEEKGKGRGDKEGITKNLMNRTVVRAF